MDIRTKCGHVMRVDLFGSPSERKRKAEKYEQNNCHNCQTRVAHDWAEAHKLPMLRGTPAQVAWAHDVRRGILAEADKLETQVLELRMRAENAPPEKFALVPKSLALVDKTLTALNALRSANQAGWWLDRRMEHATSHDANILRDAVALVNAGR